MDPVTSLIILSAALVVSELLSLIPVVRANGIFQLIYNMIGKLAGRPPYNRRRAYKDRRECQ